MARFLNKADYQRSGVAGAENLRVVERPRTAVFGLIQSHLIRIADVK